MALMVLSGSKRATSIELISNKNQGGGSKKAGTPPIANVPDSVYNAYVASGNGLLSLVNMRTNRFTRAANSYLPMNMNNVHGARIYN
jgi:hypothetical protein